MPDRYQNRTFGSVIDNAVARFGDCEALVFGNDRYTFAQLGERIDEVAAGLIKLGVRKGDHVTLWMMNRPEWIYSMFALMKIGAVLIPANTRFRTHDIEYLLKQSDSRFLITHDVSGPINFLGMVREIVDLPKEGHNIDSADFPALQGVITLGSEEHSGCIDWNDMLAGAKEIAPKTIRAHAEEVDPDDTAYIMYTSGTTGFPKGVMHSHNVLRVVEVRGSRLGVTKKDIYLNCLPLFHTFSFSEIVVQSMLAGAKQVLMETFDPDACIQLVERERITMLQGFESHFKEYCEVQERRQCDVSTLRSGLFIGGTQTSAPVCRKTVEVLAPIVTVTGFGMTETMGPFALGSLGDSIEQRAESAGYPMPGYEVRVVDPETNEELAVGEPGELICRGYPLLVGYYKKPEETAALYDEDGWLHTGDMGVERVDGYIRFLGRYKDMLKVGGENVDPMEIESLLLGLDGVQQVAVVSFPDERLTEVPIAYVQRAEGSSLKEQDVFGYCKGKVATFKIPRHVLFVNELPMTASGKVRKVELRQDALDKLGSS